MPGPALKRSKDGIYSIHWTDSGRSKRISTRSRDMAAAKAFLGTWLLLERDAPQGRAALTVADCWTIYEKQHVRANVASTATADYCWKALKPHFEAKQAASLGQDDIDLYVARRTSGRLGRKVKRQTCRRELIALLAALNHCKIALDVTLPADGPPRDRWLRPEETAALLAAAARRRDKDGHLARAERFLILALETAGRREAVCGLTWDRVDFETGVVHLHDPERRTTKKRRASVPMSKALRAMLERADNERPKPRHGAERVVGGASVNGMVEVVAEAAGLVGVTPNVLRHTAATNMARRGVPLWLIAKVLGNSLIMVDRVYAKHAPTDLVDAVAMISPNAPALAA